MRTVDRISRAVGGLLFLLALHWSTWAAEAPARPFGIQVVDEQSGRGVPMVELKTVSGVVYWTDSAGWAAIDDPAMIDQKVYFGVSSPGYEFPADGFGMRGKAVEVKPDTTAVFKIKRINLAERLYRITGEGIYADSVKLGKPVPTSRPVINAHVVGQDSAHAVEYRGKIHWFWGDTSRQGYPLGHYWTAGATSELPGKGGLDPSIGVNLEYFVDKEGFSRPMLERANGQPKWLDGVVVVDEPLSQKRPAGAPARPATAQRLIGVASRVADVGKTVGRELVIYDDATNRFRTLRDIQVDVPLFLRGHPFFVTVEGDRYVYCGDVYPNIRVSATWWMIPEVRGYQAFTPLVRDQRPGQNAVYDKANPQLERDADGKLKWEWKYDTPPLEPDQQEQLIRSGKMTRDETPFDLRDIETGRPVEAHRGSVCWNEYRKRWVMIACERGGKTSYLGEIWYAEAEKPEGPWKKARKIVTHDRYSFYNPVQHPFFDEEGGKIIYFEGTYTGTFSRKGETTPRYEYNQMMYRLDLSDTRLR